MNKRVKVGKKREPKLLGLFDVATELNISIDTARRYAKAGRLPSIRVGGRIRVPREAVIKAQREGL